MREMFDSFRGSSSAIGVILMVAVAVVMGTTVAAYTGSIISDSKRPAESAAFSPSQSGAVGDAEASETVSFVMESGSEISPQDLEIRVNGNSAEEANVSVSFPSSAVSSGDTIEISQKVADGLQIDDRVVLTYISDGSAKILAELTVEGPAPLPDKSATFIFTRYELDSPPKAPWSYAFNDDEDVDDTDINVTSVKSAVGDRSVLLQSEEHESLSNPDERSTPEITIDLNLTNVATIKFQAQGATDDLVVKVGSTKKIDNGGLSAYNSWTTVSVDVSGQTGIKELLFSAREQDGGIASIYIDDVQFFDASGDRVSKSEVLEGT